MNSDSNSEISALQRQVFSLLIALLIVSGTLTTYLYRQASLTGKDLEAIKPQAQQIIGAYNQNQKLMIDFVTQLAAYGQTHPDFRPILAKYGIGAPAAVTPKK
jgi:hypothetical protein